jgi:hypothetical protein
MDPDAAREGWAPSPPGGGGGWLAGELCDGCRVLALDGSLLAVHLRSELRHQLAFVGWELGEIGIHRRIDQLPDRRPFQNAQSMELPTRSGWKTDS